MLLNVKKEMLNILGLLSTEAVTCCLWLDDTMTAETAASLVKVTYKDVQPPLLNLDEAIKQKSFFPGAPNPLIVGDPDGKNE